MILLIDSDRQGLIWQLKFYGNEFTACFYNKTIPTACRCTSSMYQISRAFLALPFLKGIPERKPTSMEQQQTAWGSMYIILQQLENVRTTQHFERTCQETTAFGWLKIQIRRSWLWHTRATQQFLTFWHGREPWQHQDIGNGIYIWARTSNGNPQVIDL